MGKACPWLQTVHLEMREGTLQVSWATDHCLGPTAGQGSLEVTSVAPLLLMGTHTSSLAQASPAAFYKTSPF